VLEAEHRFAERESSLHLGDQSVHWECKDCGKVSEGVAMPYGQCSLCGGTLEMVEPAPLENAAAVETVRTAFEIQLGAKDFYARAARTATEPVLRAMFNHFAELEQTQIHTLARRFHMTPPESTPPSDFSQTAKFAHFEQNPEDPLNLLRLAIAFEQRALDDLNERLEWMAPDSEEYKVIRALRAEGHLHVGLLLTELERWQVGKPGLSLGAA
jgi:hypothetical protein